MLLSTKGLPTEYLSEFRCSRRVFLKCLFLLVLVAAFIPMVSEFADSHAFIEFWVLGALNAGCMLVCLYNLIRLSTLKQKR